jgi:hypothetical protein
MVNPKKKKGEILPVVCTFETIMKGAKTRDIFKKKHKMVAEFLRS